MLSLQTAMNSGILRYHIFKETMRLTGAMKLFKLNVWSVNNWIWCEIAWESPHPGIRKPLPSAKNLFFCREKHWISPRPTLRTSMLVLVAANVVVLAVGNTDQAIMDTKCLLASQTMFRCLTSLKPKVARLMYMFDVCCEAPPSGSCCRKISPAWRAADPRLIFTESL